MNVYDIIFETWGITDHEQIIHFALNCDLAINLAADCLSENDSPFIRKIRIKDNLNKKEKESIKELAKIYARANNFLMVFK